MGNAQVFVADLDARAEPRSKRRFVHPFFQIVNVQSVAARVSPPLVSVSYGTRGIVGYPGQTGSLFSAFA